MNKEDCSCPVCQAFDDGFDIGFREGYKSALVDNINKLIEIVEDMENEENVCTCGDCEEDN